MDVKLKLSRSDKKQSSQVKELAKAMNALHLEDPKRNIIKNVDRNSGKVFFRDDGKADYVSNPVLVFYPNSGEIHISGSRHLVGEPDSLVMDLFKKAGISPASLEVEYLSGSRKDLPWTVTQCADKGLTKESHHILWDLDPKTPLLELPLLRILPVSEFIQLSETVLSILNKEGDRAAKKVLNIDIDTKFGKVYHHIVPSFLSDNKFHHPSLLTLSDQGEYFFHALSTLQKMMPEDEKIKRVLEGLGDVLECPDPSGPPH